GALSDVRRRVVEEDSQTSGLRELDQPIANDWLIEIERENVQREVGIRQGLIQKFQGPGPGLPAKPDMLIFERVILGHVLAIFLSRYRARFGFDVENQLRLVGPDLVVVAEMTGVGLRSHEAARESD